MKGEYWMKSAAASIVVVWRGVGVGAGVGVGEPGGPGIVGAGLGELEPHAASRTVKAVAAARSHSRHPPIEEACHTSSRAGMDGASGGRLLVFTVTPTFKEIEHGERNPPLVLGPDRPRRARPRLRPLWP